MDLIQKKICVLGDCAVGKTSLVHRYVEGTFDSTALCMPQGNITEKVLTRENHQLNLKIWEPAGGEACAVESSHLQDVAGALLVCDLTRRETIEALYACAQSLQEVNPQACMVVAANKADLIREYTLTVADLDALCRAIHSQFLYTSAKTGENVQRIIDLLADRLWMGNPPVRT